MRKRILSFLLALVMVLPLVQPMTANALTYELADAVIVNNVGLDDGYYVLEGSTEAKKGTPPANADYAYFKDRILYLKNFDITTYRENRVSAEKVVKCDIGMYQYVNLYWDDSYLGTIINDFPLTIHLTGTNRITDSLADYSIYACYEASVTFTGDGTLEMNRPIEVTDGITVKSGTIRMTESGAGDKVPMIKTATFKMEGGNLNMRAAYRSGIECTGFTMSSGKLDMTVLGNSQYTGSGLLTTGGVTFSGGTTKIQSDGDAVQCSSLSIQDGVGNVKFISTAASEQDGNYMAVDASFVTLPTELATYVSDNADGSDASVFTSGSLIGYDSVEIAPLLSGKISGVTSTTETLVHIYETGNGVPLEIISVIGNGTYRFLVPQKGDYTILAIANGYEQQKAKITISGNTTQNFAMVEKPKFTTQPKGGTVGYNQKHTVNWATNFAPVKQELVRYSSAGSVVQTQELSAGASQINLSYMTSGYYYRIRAYYGNSSYIESDKFNVTPDAYFTPNPQFGNTEEDIIEGITYVPNSDGTFNANVHVNLNYVDGQMLQHEWVGTGYCWYDHNNAPHYGSVGTDTNKLTFTLNNVGINLVPGKEWRVKVYLADDYYADWEWQGYSFNYVTDTVPELKSQAVPAPTLKVSNVASTGKIKLTWNQVDGAAKYEVYRATSKTGTYSLLKTLTGTSLTNTSVDVGKTYYYKIRSVDANGNKSDFSSIVSRACDLPQPVVTASNVASTGKVKLTWEAIEGAAKYEVYRATSKDGTYSLLKTLTGTSLTNTSTTAGTTYYYKVKAIHSNSAANSAYSSVVSRACDLPQPTGLTATNVASSGKVKLSWTAVEGAAKYEVYRATSKSGTYSKIYTTTGTSLTNTSVEVGTTYYYKVKAIHSNSAANSAYSSVVSRTCDLPQPKVTVTNVASTGKVKLSWTAVEGAAKYEVYRATSKDGTYTKLSTTTNTTLTNTSTTAGTTYYYKVKAIHSNSAANSAYSTVVSRTCDLAQPTLTVKLNSSGKPVLTWTKVEGAVSYKVYRATSKDGTYSLLKTLTGTTLTNTSVTAGKTYYYKVIAIHSNTAANSAYSAIKSVTVK